MGIRFRCHHCEYELHVKDFQGGKRGKCPECQGKFRIPAADAEHSLDVDSDVEGFAAAHAPNDHTSTESSGARIASLKAIDSVDSTETQSKASSPGPGITENSHQRDSQPVTETVPQLTAANPAPTRQSNALPRAMPSAVIEAPEATWYVRPPSGGQYGPTDSHGFQVWLAENRVSRDSFVWRDGWQDWLAAAEAFPDYFADQANAGSTATLTATPNQPAASVPGVSAVDSPNPPTPLPQSVSLGERNRLARKQRRRRNYTFLLATLLLVTIGLVVALVVVLLRQESATTSFRSVPELDCLETPVLHIRA